MDWKKDWDEAAGLWKQPGPGHTVLTKNLKTVHSGPYATVRLLEAAGQNSLPETDSEKVLRTLLDMQWKKRDASFGCLKWYLEEEYLCDTNAAFFIGLRLIVLRLRFYEQLPPGARKLLDNILAGLNVWFRNAVSKEAFYYPNKYLGDLVCKWLLTEILGKSAEDEMVPVRMRQAADYWQKQHWGWGEHMSDSYSAICLNELSVLLLLAKQLPEDLRQSYRRLAGELLEIEDGFDGGPRVPVLRSYAFRAPIPHRNYRDRITADPRQTTNSGDMSDLGPLLYEWGWHKVMPPRQKPQRDLLIPCFGGSMATARVEKDIRLGTMSQFPVMPDAEHQTWGLSWQCFPVAISRGNSDWGYLQWETFENGQLRAHPANGGPTAHIPKAISETVEPPIVGQTFSLQRGPNALILRVMRRIPKSWESVTDRFRLLTMTADAEEISSEGWHQLLLHYPERTVSINFISLADSKKPELVRTGADSLDWNHSLANGPSSLHGQDMLVHLWAISLEGRIVDPPKILAYREHEGRSGDDSIRTIDWKWKNTHWQVTVNLQCDQVLQETRVM
jgi:hypothetical protein